MPSPHRPPTAAEFQTWWMRHQNRYKFRESGPDENLLRTLKAAYYACVSYVDYQIGRLLTLLKQTGELDNTIILFTADHGEFLGDYNCFGKRSFLDPAARIPLIMCSPGDMAAGQVCQTPTSLLDVMPTLLEAGGVNSAQYGLDGANLADIASASQTSRLVFGQLDQGQKGLYMAFDGRFKYIYSAADEAEYLIDLVEDPGETINLAGANTAHEQLTRLRTALLQRFKADSYLTPIESDGWKKFGIAADRAPEEDRIFQHARWTDPFPRLPGYTPKQS
jgi:arylsulfatase A-like enzyme